MAIMNIVCGLLVAMKIAGVGKFSWFWVWLAWLFSAAIEKTGEKQ